jgi:hypothetical protein
VALLVILGRGVSYPTLAHTAIASCRQIPCCRISERLETRIATSEPLRCRYSMFLGITPS